jgi:hypothetical protein
MKSLAWSRGALVIAVCAGASIAAVARGCASNDKGGDEPLGDGGGDTAILGDAIGDTPSAITLRIEPPAVTLDVPLGGKSGDVALKVLAKDATGLETDVTDKASLSLSEPTLATFVGAKIGGATHGGKADITATLAGATASATLTVKLAGDVVPSGFDPTSKGKFDAATVDPTPASQPVIEYPLEAAIVPRNVPPMEVQWKKGGDTSAYRVRFTAPGVLDVAAYGTTLESILDAAPWSAVVESAAGGKMQIVVEGLGVTGLQLHRSAPVTITVARDRIDDSAIYYWESSSGSLHALDFAAGKNSVLPVTGSKYAPGSPAVCIACHTVSRDGTRFSYTSGDFSLGTLAASADKKSFAASIEPGTKVPAGFKWTYAAFDPKESTETPAVLVTKADAPATQNAPGHVRLELLHPDTGAVIASNLVAWLTAFPAGVGRDILQPDWSPSGFVVFSSYDSEASNPDASAVLKKAYVRDLGDDAVNTSILEATVAWDATKKSFTFGAPKVLVKAKAPTSLDTSETDVLPQISPDDTLVAFTRSDGWWPIRLQSDAVNGTGRIAIVRRSDGHVVELSNASGPANSNSTWPQWAPTAGSEYLWVAFSSERPYGHRMAPGVALPAECKPQGRTLCKNMWIAAVDKKLATTGTLDPSAVPFWMPGQTALASAVSPRWTKAVVGVAK